jgi:hypothetical protein
MHTALCRLALFPNVTLIPMVSEPQQVSHAVRGGRPTDHLPQLTPDDVVYTAGAPAMTDAVARMAKAGGAQCYTDPFVQEARTVEQPGLMSQASRDGYNGAERTQSRIAMQRGVWTRAKSSRAGFPPSWRGTMPVVGYSDDRRREYSPNGHIECLHPRQFAPIVARASTTLHIDADAADAQRRRPSRAIRRTASAFESRNV